MHDLPTVSHPHPSAPLSPANLNDRHSVDENAAILAYVVDRRLCL